MGVNIVELNLYALGHGRLGTCNIEVSFRTSDRALYLKALGYEYSFEVLRESSVALYIEKDDNIEGVRIVNKEESIPDTLELLTGLVCDDQLGGL